MRGTGTRRTVSNRRASRIAVAAAIGLAIVLQIFAVSSHAHFSVRNFDSATGFVVAVDAPCLATGKDADKLPGHAHAEHPLCCLYCAERSLHESWLDVITTPDVAIQSPADPIALYPRRIANDRIQPPLGWTSSWSSRAPPSFS
ncbi:MAG: hypothetical protein AB7U61_10115 [Methylocystis sp.]